MYESVSERFGLAQQLIAVKQGVARAITEEFFLNHPDWAARFGERGRQFCTADTCLHIDFLAGAIEADCPEAFADYSRWTARMLAARGIAEHTLEENLGQLESHLLRAIPPEEREAVLSFLGRGRQACSASKAAPADLQASEGSLSLTQKIFLAAILRGKREAALKIVEEALHVGHSHVDIYVEVFAVSLQRVGELWELNKISVAQEHMATAITQYVIALIYPRMVPYGPRRGGMVVTGVSGELHQVGANLVADAMEAKGWEVRFLGTNLPHSSVLASLEESAADVLCISTTIVANLPSVTELVRTVRSKMGQRAPKIVLGGGAYRIATQFAGEMKAVGVFTDLRKALATFCS